MMSNVLVVRGLGDAAVYIGHNDLFIFLPFSSLHTLRSIWCPRYSQCKKLLYDKEKDEFGKSHSHIL